MDGISKLKLEEADVPTPRDGEVLVKIHAVSLNYRDIEVCTGEYDHHKTVGTAKDSIVPCSDMCGTVVASSSPRLKQGTRVMAIFNQSHLSGAIKESDMATGLGFPLPGVLAQHRVFPAESLVVVPDYMTSEEASCLPIASVTAWTSLTWRSALNPKEAALNPKNTVLFQGTGGVSIAGLQIAKAAGLRAIITSSDDEKLARAKNDLRADEGVNYRTHWQWQEAVMKATDNRGADIIFETGGTKTLRKSFACVAFGGLINCIGYLSGKTDDDNEGGGKEPELHRLNVNVLALRRNVTLKGIINGSRDDFEAMVRFYEKNEIRPVISKTFKFEEAKEALQYVADGQHFGKVVIKIDDE